MFFKINRNMKEVITLSENRFKSLYNDEEYEDEDFSYVKDYSHNAVYGMKIVLVIKRKSDSKLFKIQFYSDEEMEMTEYKGIEIKKSEINKWDIK